MVDDGGCRIKEKNQNRWLIFDAPPDNRLSPLRAEELAEHTVELGDPPEPRVVFLRSGGDDAFCPGWQRGLDESELRAATENLRTTTARLASLEVPSVACVQGNAFGPGLELALSCDLRLASPGAHFGFPQLGREGIPGAGGTQRLSRLIGSARAKEWLFTGRRISCEDAKEAGLVDRITPVEYMDVFAGRLAEDIAQLPATMVRLAKRAVDRGRNQSLERGLEVERDCFEESLGERNDG